MICRTRRAFSLGPASRLFLAAAVALMICALAQGQPQPKSKVVTVRSPKVINSRNQVDLTEAKAMLAAGLEALTGKKEAKAAWAVLGLKPADVVGIKINCNNWTITLSPPAELLQALTDSLAAVVPANNIIVYEASIADLESSGFKRNSSTTGVRFMGCKEGAGFDDQERLSQIATSTCTKLINFASLKCVEQGLGASLFFKNHIGSLVEKDMPKCHGNMDFLASVLAKPSLKRKTILNICNGLRGTYKQGVPWYWGGIILGQDPVAAEWVGYQIINEKREQEKTAALPGLEYLKIAESKYGLGTCTPGHVDWVKIER
ncbi:MAG TPA: DUF362 domain-containing protein [Acidobacteriota bacterium]